MSIPSVKLNSGHSIDQLGFGTWQSAPKEVEKAVEEAIKAGYRHLDLAKVYQNQPEVAAGIKKAGVPRSELFLTSKLWNNSHQPENVEAALEDTLKELNTDYLDLYLIHWPVSFPNQENPHKNLFPKEEAGKKVLIDDKTSCVDTWKAMIKLRDSGKCKSIGVSNFSTEAIDTLIKETGVTPAVHQIERHPLLLQPELVQHHADKGIHITAYSLLGNNTTNIPLLIENDTVKKVAEKINATPAQVLIAWGMIGGHSVIPKSVTPSRITSNFEAKSLKLEKDDVELLNSIESKDGRKRYNVPITYNPSWDVNCFGEDSEKKAAHQVKVA